MGGGGMKLGRSSPWRSRSASHSLSLTSVLRPGTAFRCWALTRMSGCPSSSTLNTGRQSTPVLSMATWVTPWNLSQSPSANNSAVLVPKVRTNRCCVPSGSLSRTRAPAVFWWMSKPQPRGYRTCIPHAPLWDSQREVRREPPVSPACSPPGGGATVLCTGTHQDQLRHRASRTKTPRSRLAGSALKYVSQFHPLPCLLQTSRFVTQFSAVERQSAQLCRSRDRRRKLLVARATEDPTALGVSSSSR